MIMQKWLESGKYLPMFLRDHHAQKQLFKCIHLTVDIATSVQNPPNWIDAHCYVIDIFLWYMAKRGYTLQRCRNPSLTFNDLQKDLAAFRDDQNFLLEQKLNKREGKQ